MKEADRGATDTSRRVQLQSTEGPSYYVVILGLLLPPLRLSPAAVVEQTYARETEGGRRTQTRRRNRYPHHELRLSGDKAVSRAGDVYVGRGSDGEEAILGTPGRDKERPGRQRRGLERASELQSRAGAGDGRGRRSAVAAAVDVVPVPPCEPRWTAPSPAASASLLVSETTPPAEPRRARYAGGSEDVRRESARGTRRVLLPSVIAPHQPVRPGVLRSHYTPRRAQRDVHRPECPVEGRLEVLRR